MRKLNIDKIRRHMARTTPDVAEISINPVRDNDSFETTDAFYRRFRKRMTLKHGENNIREFHVETYDDFRDYPSVLFKIRVVLYNDIRGREVHPL